MAYVSEITPEEITTSVNRDELHGDNSPEQNLAEYLAEKEKSPEDAQRIIELARPIISEAMEKGRLETPTGVFMPVEIEVKNYRNYRDELFSYDGISFATINGENGAGKSSLFMDAMLDALFEEPREGDLTGWICNDPDARSGSIKFTFYLGDKLYRVTRTRTKSGKATLNLSEYVDESWQNRSAEKYRDTQAIIENTIGMDSLTLKATGLIMQDQYGLFLQADKADRMAIGCSPSLRTSASFTPSAPQHRRNRRSITFPAAGWKALHRSPQRPQRRRERHQPYRSPRRRSTTNRKLPGVKPGASRQSRPNGLTASTRHIRRKWTGPRQSGRGPKSTRNRTTRRPTESSRRLRPQRNMTAGSGSGNSRQTRQAGLMQKAT